MPSQYVMIAGKNDDALGSDTMNGRFGQTDFEWQEGAGPLVVNGAEPGVQTPAAS